MEAQCATWQFQQIAYLLNVFEYRNMELPLREVEHVEVRSTIHYLTAINKTAKEIHDEIQRVYEVGCMNVQNRRKCRRKFIAG